MPPSALRLRRALTLSYSLLHRHSLARPTVPLHTPRIPQVPEPSYAQSPSQLASSRFFTSTTVSLSSGSRSLGRNYDDDEEIGPDTILFEGCDYNHWLIVCDFPKDPKPSPEEMVKFYEETAGKIFGSLEEGKKKIYACSTTTYNGFQVECSEETSKKFEGLPGVIFVLPDSYIDPVNKEYGGDKYINGQIIPRPPPIQYGPRGPRRDSRDFRSRPSPRGPMEGNRNYGPPPPPSTQQNFGPPPSTQQNFGPPPSTQQNFGPPPSTQQNFPPRPQQNYAQPHPPQQHYAQPHSPQQHYGPPQNFQPQQNYGPPGAGERRGPIPVNNVPGEFDNSQGGRRDQLPSYQPSYNQGERGNFYPQGQGDFSQSNQRSYAPPEHRGFAGPASQGGNFGQSQPGAQGQEIGSAYSQNYPSDQRR